MDAVVLGGVGSGTGFIEGKEGKVLCGVVVPEVTLFVVEEVQIVVQWLISFVNGATVLHNVLVFVPKRVNHRHDFEGHFELSELVCQSLNVPLVHVAVILAVVLLTLVHKAQNEQDYCTGKKEKGGKQKGVDTVRSRVTL